MFLVFLRQHSFSWCSSSYQRKNPSLKSETAQLRQKGTHGDFSVSCLFNFSKFFKTPYVVFLVPAAGIIDQIQCYNLEQKCMNVQPRYEISIVYVSRSKTHHSSLQASFDHCNSQLVIEVEEDNDCIYSSTHLFFLSAALSIRTISFLSPPCPFIPSTQPGRVYLMTRALSCFLRSQVGQLNLNVCVSVCVCEHAS